MTSNPWVITTHATTASTGRGSKANGPVEGNAGSVGFEPATSGDITRLLPLFSRISSRAQWNLWGKRWLYSFDFKDHWTNTVSTTRNCCALFIKKRKIPTMENSSYIRVDGLPCGSTETVRHSDLIKNILLTILIGWAWHHPALSFYREFCEYFVWVLSFQYSYFKLSHSKYINEERDYNSFYEQL